MADNKTDYLERKVLNHVLGIEAFTQPSAIYVSLHENDPTDTGDDSGEVSGGSYARKVATFSDADTVGGVTSCVNEGDISWAGLPDCEVTHIGIWDAGASGNMLYSAPLVTPRIIQAGSQLLIAAGQLTISEK